MHQQMKVVVMLGGLGSQMFKYAFLLALKEQSSQECIIDTSAYKVMDMWNGYELEKIFGIQEKDLKDCYSQEEWREIIESHQGYNRDFPLKYMESLGDKVYYYNRGIPTRYFGRNQLLKCICKFGKMIQLVRIICGDCDYYPNGYALKNGSAFFDEFEHRSDEYFRDYKTSVCRAFQFPDFDDSRDENKLKPENVQKNINISKQMQQGNSVAFHVRRGDHMYDNGALFERGYYKKAVEFIKNNTSDKQTFYLFSDDLQWCVENKEELGLDDTDRIIPIDWNTGAQSFRDMQLMTYCQHNIIPISSFSWWGYYLSQAKNKIVCAPTGYWLEIENHF
jgi:hypothetical protein